MNSRSDAVEEEVEVLEKRLVDALLRQRMFVCAEGIAGFFAGIGGIIGFDWNMIVGFVVNGTVLVVLFVQCTAGVVFPSGWFSRACN